MSISTGLIDVRPELNADRRGDNSTSPPLALEPQTAHYAFGPIRPTSRPTLFDHLVGERQQSRGHGDTKLLCGFLVDHQSEFARLLDR